MEKMSLSRFAAKASIAAIIAGMVTLPAPGQVASAQTTPLSCITPPSGMVSWWPGDGNADDVWDGNNGTVNGATFVAGKVGQAFSLDGNADHISIPNNPNLDAMKSALTWDAWIKTSSTAPYQAILEWGQAGAAQGAHFYVRNGTDLFANLVRPTAPVSNSIVAPNVLTPGTWHHVALTYDGTISPSPAALYVDGQQVLTKTFTPGGPLKTGNNLLIGTRLSGGGPRLSFDGLIDEVEVFDQVLSVNDIKAIYDAGVAGKCQPECCEQPEDMVSWWKGEGNGDDSKDNNDGTVNGATYAAGKVGRAFSFDGVNDYVHVDYSSNLDSGGKSAVTVDAWVKPASATQNKYAVVVEKKNGIFSGGYGEWSLQFLGDPNDPRVTFGVSDASNVKAWATTKTKINDPNRWYHIAAVYNGTSAKIYVDGSLERTNSGPINNPIGGVLNDVNAPITIGAFTHISGVNQPKVRDFFKGEIDEVEVIDRALSDAEIRSLFAARHEGKCELCTTAPTGMVSWWEAEGDATDSVDGNDGALIGDTFFTTGKVGKAFNFDGVDDYVSVPSAANLNPANEITVDAWVFLKSYPSQVTTVVMKGTAVNRQRQYFLGINRQGSARFTVDPGTATANTAKSGGGVVPLNTWTHLTGTHAKDGINGITKIYVNGVLKGTNDNTLSLFSTPNPLLIGSFVNQTAGRFFHGSIDEVELFDRALSASEIQAIYNADNGGKCEPVCGNGIHEAAEECDDGNLENIDGCDNMCRIEHAADLKVEAIRELEELKPLCPEEIDDEDEDDDDGKNKCEKYIDHAIKEIKKSLGNRHVEGDKKIVWIDEDTLECKHGNKVFDKEKHAVEKLLDVIKKFPALSSEANHVIKKLVLADTTLADVATVGSTEELEKCLSETDPKKAIKNCRKAWKNAACPDDDGEDEDDDDDEDEDNDNGDDDDDEDNDNGDDDDDKDKDKDKDKEKDKKKGKKHASLPWGGSLWSLVKSTLGLDAAPNDVAQGVVEVAEENDISIPEWGVEGEKDSRSLMWGSVIDMTPILEMFR